MKYLIAFYTIFVSNFYTQAQSSSSFTYMDTLRGANEWGRKKWDVLYYQLSIEPDISNKSIQGKNEITFIDSGSNMIQIDLQNPMKIDSVLLNKKKCTFQQESDVYWVNINHTNRDSIQVMKLLIYFHGKPRIAVRPPWDGGWIWEKDKHQQPWISVACQGIGASSWYPCKDIQSDEPDYGAEISITVPSSIQAVSNGRLLNIKTEKNDKKTYQWIVKNPINNYNIIPYLGRYTHLSDTFLGLQGTLDIDYWILEDNAEKAEIHFKDVKRMLKAFEYWFGPYPFYEDGYKLVESPYLGMEHQSAIAYGNQYMKGYLGKDLSQSGWGLLWDFIIVHESGHEWFGNSITANDIADNWIHEGFANYSETLFTEYYYGKKAATAYITGLRKSILNDRPIIGPYGVHKEGSGDMYNKGGNMIHTIRQIINDDNKFKTTLHKLQKEFYHQTVTSKQIEEFLSKAAGFDLSKVFNQYLRTPNIPLLEYYMTSDSIKFRWNNCVNDFNMPIQVRLGQQKKEIWIYPETKWKGIQIQKNQKEFIYVNENFFVSSKRIKKGK